MYVPRPEALGTGQTAIGKFDIAGEVINAGYTPRGPYDIPGLAGGMVKLNDGYVSPGVAAFPGGADRSPTPQPTQRGAQFTIVGSAAAVMLHELPESNPEGEYVAAHNSAPPITYMLYPYPDDPDAGWDAGPSGLGSPIVFVIGGRTSATGASDLVQKYYPFGYGGESLIYDSYEISEDFSFQTTCNQTDIWSAYFVRPDIDHYPPPVDPQIPTRAPSATGGGGAGPLPVLPDPLYGLMAVGLETGVQTSAPSFPLGSYRNIYTFGGIDENGAVRDEVRWWNIGLPPTQIGEEIEDGVFSEVSTMPSPRAYGKAVYVPSNGSRIALVGGYDQVGVPLDTVDVYSFDNPDSPVAGSWETFAGTLPEALIACGAGYSAAGAPAEGWVLAFGGWTGERYTHHTYNARLDSPGNLVIREPLVVVPRSNVGSSQSGSGPLEISFNRYYLFCGTDENGSESIVEIVSLP